MLRRVFKVVPLSLLALPTLAYAQDSQDLCDPSKPSVSQAHRSQSSQEHDGASAPVEDPMENIVRGLNETGVKMYGAYWYVINGGLRSIQIRCGYCVRQLNMFGKHRPDVPYVECGIPDKRGCIILNTTALTKH